jgi:hypothetical protein
MVNTCVRDVSAWLVVTLTTHLPRFSATRRGGPGLILQVAELCGATIHRAEPACGFDMSCVTGTDEPTDSRRDATRADFDDTPPRPASDCVRTVAVYVVPFRNPPTRTT